MTWEQCLNSEDILMATTIRRVWLGDNHPACPECGEKMQVQLVEYLQPVPDWRCRTCKHKFKYEPTPAEKRWS